MRVALVASLVSPLQRAEANGPHAVIIDLAHGLARRGHQARIYAAAGSVVPAIELTQVPVDPIAAAATVGSGEPAPAEATAALNRGFEELFATLRGDAPDVVSQHAFDAVAIRRADEGCALHTLHLPPLDSDVVAAARAAQGPIVTVSEAARRDWNTARIASVVIRNGVPDRSPGRAPVRPVAVIAGRISPEKGTDTAIRVARRAGLAPLVVGDVHDRRYFRDAVEPLLRPRQWIGAVSRDELSRLMALSAVLLMPIRWEEPFGLVAAEAQMAGCPVAGYRRGALPEVVAEPVGGVLVESDDEDALVGAVVTARALDRHRVRRRAQRELGVERMVDEYERALLAVARGRPSPSHQAAALV